MTTTRAPGSVVIGYDGSHHADQALTWAAEQADSENRCLTIVHVLSPPAGDFRSLTAAQVLSDDMRKAIWAGGRSLLVKAQARVLELFPGLEVMTSLGEGDPCQILTRMSEDASCLVLGSRGRGRVASLLFGSVSVAVSRDAACPVVVIRPFHRGKVRHGIVVGTDAGEHTRATLEFAYRQASLRDQPLTVVYCIPFYDDPNTDVGLIPEDAPGMDEHRRVLAESVAGMAERFPEVRAQLRLGHGPAEQCLVGLSDSLDLVVVGRHHGHARGDLIGLGACSPAVIEGASCPVAVIHQPVAEPVLAAGPAQVHRG